MNDDDLQGRTGTPIIDIRKLGHAFGDIRAVDGLDLQVDAGTIVSLLGPNGAGKSTTINVLTTLLEVQEGSATVAGHDVESQRDEVRRDIGIVFQDQTLDGDMTVWETLEFQGWIHYMDKSARSARIDELLKVVDLEAKRDLLVKTLSGGMKRRLEIARGLLTRPKVLFLDEPTVGLDPQTRHYIWEYIKTIRDEGVTVLVTTHYMDEADTLSDRIFIMDRGTIIAQGTSEELKDSIGSDMVYISAEDMEGMESAVKGLDGVTGTSHSTRGLVVTLEVEGAEFLPRLFDVVKERGLVVDRISLARPTLDDVFIRYTGRALRELDGGSGDADAGPSSNGGPGASDGGDA